MKLKLLTLSLVFIAGSLLLSSCGSLTRGVVGKSLTVEKGTIPPEFAQKDQVLIVLMWGTKSYDKYAMKAFDKRYTGKKIYVGLADLLSNEKFEDLDTYRYVFSQGPGELAMYSGQSYSYTSTGSRPFHIFDRKEQKFYKSSITSGNFGAVMQAYADKLDEAIK